jgi:adenylyltransferase/sulfurtransferase
MRQGDGSEHDATANASPLRDLTAEQAHALLRERQGEICLLDVRTPKEHKSHRIPGSVLVPVQDLGGRVGELDPARPTLVYCEHGVRSRAAAAFLRQVGFREVFHLRGGIVTWDGPFEAG